MARFYEKEWYERRIAASRESARVVLPIVLKIIQPASVVDVGCGTGSWLHIVGELGVDDVVGVDGPHVDRALLEIEPTKFVAHDLSRPLDLGRSFDLALCLEVGEHLPSSSASTLVDSLTALAPAVLFSAAIPGQGGTRHRNEQWPEYWAALFAGRGYHAHDFIRTATWRDPRVRYFYSQNTILYVCEDGASRYQGLPLAIPDVPLSLVHPRLFERALGQLPASDRIGARMTVEFVGRLMRKMRRSVRNRDNIPDQV